MLTSTVSSKGQITVPKQVREFLHIESADKVAFIIDDDGRVILTHAKNAATALFGMLNKYKQAKPVSAEDMEAAILRRRAQRVKK